MIGASEGVVEAGGRLTDAKATAIADGFRPPIWLLAIGLGVPTALVAIAASPLGRDFIYVMIGIPALLLLWTLAGVVAAVMSVRAAMRKAWRRSFVLSVLPLVLLCIAPDHLSFVRACNYLGNVAHFIWLKPYYDREIAALPADQTPRLVMWDWGGMVWCSIGLVYDETDQVALLPGRQSAEWQAQAKGTELSCEGYSVEPLWGHYYLGSFPC
jgi:hypothetical protein